MTDTPERPEDHDMDIALGYLEGSKTDTHMGNLYLQKLITEYRALRTSLPMGRGEVKDRDLDAAIKHLEHLGEDHPSCDYCTAWFNSNQPDHGARGPIRLLLAAYRLSSQGEPWAYGTESRDSRDTQRRSLLMPDEKKEMELKGGIPARVAAKYTIPLYRHPSGVEGLEAVPLDPEVTTALITYDRWKANHGPNLPLGNSTIDTLVTALRAALSRDGEGRKG